MRGRSSTVLPERITFGELMSGRRAGGPETKSPLGSKLDILGIRI